MQIGDTVLHVNGTSPIVRKVHLDALTDDRFSVYDQSDGIGTWWHGWGQIFDNPTAADQAIVRNIDKSVASLQKQIDNLLADRATVMARLGE